MRDGIFDISNLTDEELTENNEFINFDIKDFAKAMVESSIGDIEEE